MGTFSDIKLQNCVGYERFDVTVLYATVMVRVN